MAAKKYPSYVECSEEMAKKNNHRDLSCPRNKQESQPDEIAGAFLLQFNCTCSYVIPNFVKMEDNFQEYTTYCNLTNIFLLLACFEYIIHYELNAGQF